MTVPGDPELPDHELPLQGIIIIYARINTCKQQAERGAWSELDVADQTLFLAGFLVRGEENDKEIFSCPPLHEDNFVVVGALCKRGSL